jgi:hypothetical protein
MNNSKNMENSKKVSKKSMVSSVINCVSTILETALSKDAFPVALKALQENSGILQKTIDSAVKKSKKSKKVKDPNAPKRAKSNYILFCEDRRPKLKSKNPTFSAKELIIECGKAWKSSSEKEKEKFRGLAQKDKERYQSEMEKYTPAEPSSFEKEPKEKRPLTAYLCYYNAVRKTIAAEMPGQNSKEVTKAVGARWKSLTDAEKQKYSELAKSGASSATATTQQSTSAPVTAAATDGIETIGSKSKRSKK